MFISIFDVGYAPIVLWFVDVTQHIMPIIFVHNLLYLVSSQERLWRHWARPMIQAARRILFESFPVFIFECVRKHKLHDNKHLPPKYALTSQSFSRWDKVYIHHNQDLLFLSRVCTTACWHDITVGHSGNLLCPGKKHYHMHGFVLLQTVYTM